MRNVPALLTCVALAGCGSTGAVVPQSNASTLTWPGATGPGDGAAAPLNCVTAPRPFDETAHPARVEVTATMHRFGIEGGFWAFCGDDGVTYDPVSLPAEYRKERLRVRATLTIQYGLVGTHQVGPLVEITAISTVP